MDNGDVIDDDYEAAYITPVCGELAAKEEVNEVDLQVVNLIPSQLKLDFGTKLFVVDNNH